MELLSFRKNRKLSQQQVAQSIGIPIRTYCGYELESREPSINMLVKLADFFEVTVDELLGRVPEQELFDDARVPKPEIQEIYDNLSPDLQLKAKGYLYGLADLDSERLLEIERSRKRA